MAVTFTKPFLSIGHCLGSSQHGFPLSVLTHSTVSCRPKCMNISLRIGPRCLQQKTKISNFSCFSLPCPPQRLVAIEKGLYSPSATDSPEGELDSDISGKPEPFSCFTQENSDDEIQKLEISLPRRSLLVSFTCDACSSRTKRRINRHAYERGTVFLQCAGCEAYHKLVDNLGLVVEYDFRDDFSSEADPKEQPDK